MAIATEWSAGQCRLRISDEFTVGVAAAFKSVLLAALGGAQALEIDLSEVTELDSAGFQLLALMKREAGAAGKQLAFTGHSPAVLRVFDIYSAAHAFGDPIVLSSSCASA